MRNGSIRRVSRLASVTLVDAVLLLLLAEILPGFNADGFGAALALAILLGLANALLWPLLIRVALPFTVLTLGLGALILNGLVLLAIAAIDTGIHVEDLGSAIVVTLALTVLSSISSAILALDSGDLWYRTVVRRQLKRTKLAVESDVPGILFLEIDGLAHEIVQRAMRDGNAPALARWIHDGSHELKRWETDWSSQTGACQAGILHGRNSDMPAFRWWEKEHGRAIVTNHPKDAAELERRASDGRGLLHADGASRANILSGDAPHSLLTMSTVLDRRRQGRLGQDYFAYFASPYGVALTFMRCIGEIVSERWSAIQQVRRDVRPRINRGGSYPLMRAFGTVIQLDLQVAAVTADVLGGRPVVYTTFLAYDEVAHHSGVERPETLAVLRRVDRAIARIAAAVEHAPRPYRLVVLADHGQSQGATFLQRYGESLEQLVERVCGDGDVALTAATSAESDESRGQLRAGFAELGTRPGVTGRAAKAIADRQTEKAQLEQGEQPPEIVVMASGNLGLISFPREPGRVTLEQIEQRRPGLLDALRTHPGIGFVLVRSEADGAVALGENGRHLLDSDVVEGEDPLRPFGPRAADHVRRTDRFSTCPDIVVNSTYWADTDEVAAFEELVGSHGGLGGTQAHPFVLHPAELPWPAAHGHDVVGSETIHRIFCGWLHALGHDGYDPFAAPGDARSSD